MIYIHDAMEMMEGAGARVKRLMPIPRLRNFDPFVLWDDFSISPGSGFPEHPHRGFEAITYLFSGTIRHEDNLGNASTVTMGGAQRFTAGRGIVHSEMPAQNGTTRGIQMWINLPQRLKQTEPGYQQVDHDEFPIEKINGGQIKTIVGKQSPLKLLTPASYLDIQLSANTKLKHPITSTMRGFIYMVEGEIAINNISCATSQAAFIDNEQELKISSKDNSHFMLCLGTPHHEPIFQHGPYVD